VAFTKEHIRSGHSLAEPGKDRALLKWGRPTQISPGLTHALNIEVPESDVITPCGAIGESPITWVSCPVDWEVCLSVLLGAPGAWAPGWPGRRAMRTQLVHHRQLANCEQLWIVSHLVRLSATRRGVLVDDRVRIGREALARGWDIDFHDPSHRIMDVLCEDGLGVVRDLAIASLLMEAGSFARGDDRRED
jgi:hypothetical protein